MNHRLTPQAERRSLRSNGSAASSGLLAPPFRGMIPPMITPLRDRDTLDVRGLAMTKAQFEPVTLRRALQIDKIIGIKDSSGDLTYFTRVLEIAKARPDWSVLMGPEPLLAEAIKRGGHGGVNGGALVDPRL